MSNNATLDAAIRSLSANRDAIVAEAQQMKGDAFSSDVSDEISQLEAMLNGVDVENPASLLALQVMLTQYESALATLSALQQSYVNLLQTIVQNLR